MERMTRRNYEDLIKTLQDVPGEARVPAENPHAEDPPAEVQAAAEPEAAEREEQEHQEEERGRLLEELQEQRARLQEARALQEAKAKEKAKKEKKKEKRNVADRTKYWHEKMAGLEDQLTGARRRGQDWLIAVIVEEMAGIPARAAAAG